MPEIKNPIKEFEIMDRRKFIKTAGIGTAAISLPGVMNLRCQPESADKKPSIIILFTDDQRYDTINALNCPEIHTPNMDRLVKNGVSFTHAHIMGGTSGAVCMPSRAMLLTGKSLFHLQNRGASIPEDHIMLPEVLKEAGYKTFGTGKWHNGRKAYARCFTHGAKVFFGGMSNHLEVPVYDFDNTGEYLKDKQYIGKKFSSVLFTDEVINFLENETGENPFFAYVPYTAPHDPRMAPREFEDMYPREKIKLPENYLTEHPFDNGEMDIRDENLAPKPRTEDVVREHLAAYYAMITHLDAQIGRILDTLESTGKADDTIIVFAGDNGLAVGCHGLMGKQNLYDHSVRVPLIISGPGIPKGVQAGGLCYLNDIYATICELTDIPVPQSVEGKSLVPMLENKNSKIRDSLFLAYTKIHRGIRTKDSWKLIKYNVNGKQTSQLFDLNTDPHEINNLAGEEKNSERLNELSAKLKTQMKELDDFCDLDKPNWGIPEEVIEKKEVKHLAVGKDIKLKNSYSKKYPGEGDKTLVNGLRGTSKFFDGSWQGFHEEDLVVTIDLGKQIEIKKVTAGFLEDQSAWIFLPEFVEFLFSGNEKDFSNSFTVKGEKAKFNRFRVIKDFSNDFQNVKARYVRIRAKNTGRCPSWHQGSGEKAWLFADEIIVE